jgi:hypothetical protein
MVSTFTPNIQLEEPARGDDVGTWDTPVNSNMTELDLCLGGIATISAAAGSVVLSATQLQSRMLTFNSTLAASITVTLKTSFVKDYIVQHIATGSSAFTITLQTTAAAGQAVSIPPGEATTVFNDGTNIKFTSLARVGSYWDYAGSSVPAWVSGCTVPPYLACTGGAVSSATYPVLFSMIGATLPDSRGRGRMYLDAGVGRVSSAASGVAGNTLFAGGGDQLMPTHSHSNSLSDPGHSHIANLFNLVNGGTRFGGTDGGSLALTDTVGSAVTGISITNANAGTGVAANMAPTFVGGITLIRAA